MSKSDFRSQLKATAIKKLRKAIDEDDAMVGVQQSNEYLNLEDGKTMKIRIFPAHPGVENFYISKKCYWLPCIKADGDPGRTWVLDSRIHGGTKMDIVEEYVKYAKKKVGDDAEKLDALVGTGVKSNSLNPTYSWLCYADQVDGDEPLHAKIWEFKKMVRDGLNKLAFNEGDDEPIEVDPFTDPDEGLPILATYRKNPNKKRGENYYEVSFPNKPKARPLTDEEIEDFMQLPTLNEVLPAYGMRDFEKALECLQIFDDDNDINAFDDDNWLEIVETIKAQYDAEEEETKSTKKSKKSETKKVKQAPASEPDEDEEDDEEPETEEESESDGDKFDEMDRSELKKYIKKQELDIKVKTSMSDDDIRDAIREAENVTEDEEPEEEEPETDDDEDDDNDDSPKLSLADIKKKLAGKK